MSAHILSSLSNRDYDDYVRQQLSRLERQADMIARLATEERNRDSSDPYYYDHATTPRSHNNRSRRSIHNSSNNRSDPHDQNRMPVRRRPSSDNTRSHQQQRPTSYQDSLYAYSYRPEEGYYNDPPRTPHHQREHRGRRPRSASTGARSTEYYDDRYSDYRYSDFEEDGDFDDLDYFDGDSEALRREIITRRNTRRNAVKVVDVPLDQFGIQDSQPTVHNNLPVDPVSRTQQAPSPPQSQQSFPPPQLSQPSPGQQIKPGEQLQQQPPVQLHREEQLQQQPPVQPQPVVGVAEEQQSGSAATTPNLSTGTATSQSTGTASPLKKKRWPWSLFTSGGSSTAVAATTSDSKQSQQHHSPMPMATTSTPVQGNQGKIWPVSTTGPRGDTLSPAQQEEIVRQLPGSIFTTKPQEDNNTNDFAKIANLQFIWVFRAAETTTISAAAANMWITFDYQNQKLLTQHYYRQLQQSTSQPIDNGIELLDSHIRNGRLPVLIFPSRQEAFYATTLSAEHVIKLQVSCLSNSKDVKFVYRQQQH